MNNESKICILGGGFGGLYTALYLSRSSQVRSGQCQITLIEQKEHFLFTPLLYELITGELQCWQIAPSYYQLLIGTKIDLCQQKIQDVNLRTRQVNLENGEILTYNYLVLAVGCQNRWPAIEGLSTYALTFRTLADVERLQTQLHILENSERQHIRLAVIGAGPNGVELACKLADKLGRRGEIQLIERGERILENFPDSVGIAARKAMKRRNIQVNLETQVKAIASDAITIVTDNQVGTLPIDLVVWTAGTQSWEWIRTLGCQQNQQGKLLTRPTLQLVEYSDVFAIGDVADIRNGKKSVPATAQAAYQQARCLSKNLVASMDGKPLHPFHYLHLGDMLTLGRKAGLISSFGLNLTGRLADIIRRFVYILRLPTQRHRLKVLQHWFKKTLMGFLQGIRWQLKKLFSLKFIRSSKKKLR